MAKRKVVAESSDEEEYSEEEAVAATSSPERPIQSARKSGKKVKVQADSDEESEEEEPKPAKKSKADAKKSKAAAKPTSIKKPNYGTAQKVEEDHGDVKVGVDESGDKYVELGKKRRATVRQFKGATFLDIREFYGDENDLKPGKKGISLSREQWEALKKGSEAIDSFFAKLGK